jgi:two-component system chemotaxis response regulator CheY
MVDILIADDSDAIRLVLKEILIIGEHNVVAEAIDGAEAVDFYQKHKPQLLMTDFSMPNKDGLQVVKEVIAIDPNAKIILITASDDKKIIQECIDSGATTMVTKPFDFKVVLKTITEVMEN